MKLALSLFISASLHVTVLAIPLSFSKADKGTETHIPIVLHDLSEGIFPGAGGDGKPKGKKGQSTVVGQKHDARLPMPAKRRSSEPEAAKEPSEKMDPMAEERSHKPSRNDVDVREPIATSDISPVSLPLPISDRAGAAGYAVASLGELGGEGATGGSDGKKNSGGGSGSGQGSGGFGKPAFYRPRYAHSPKPEYPETARERGWEGTVLLRVLVSLNGRAEKITVSQSSGFATLDQAAIKAVESWRFHPARDGATVVESWVKIPIVFELKNYNSGIE